MHFTADLVMRHFLRHESMGECLLGIPPQKANPAGIAAAFILIMHNALNQSLPDSSVCAFCILQQTAEENGRTAMI